MKKIQHRCCKELYYHRNAFIVSDEDIILFRAGERLYIEFNNCPFCGVKLKLDIPRLGKVKVCEIRGK